MSSSQIACELESFGENGCKIEECYDETLKHALIIFCLGTFKCLTKQNLLSYFRTTASTRNDCVINLGTSNIVSQYSQYLLPRDQLQGFA